jgi:hypothetical protein
VRYDIQYIYVVRRQRVMGLLLWVVMKLVNAFNFTTFNVIKYGSR